MAGYARTLCAALSAALIAACVPAADIPPAPPPPAFVSASAVPAAGAPSTPPSPAFVSASAPQLHSSALCSFDSSKVVDLAITNPPFDAAQYGYCGVYGCNAVGPT